MDHSLPGSSVYRIPRQEYWSGLPFSFLGNLSTPGIKAASPALADRFFSWVTWEAHVCLHIFPISKHKICKIVLGFLKKNCFKPISINCFRKDSHVYLPTYGHVILYANLYLNISVNSCTPVYLKLASPISYFTSIAEASSLWISSEFKKPTHQITAS